MNRFLNKRKKIQKHQRTTWPAFNISQPFGARKNHWDNKKTNRKVKKMKKRKRTKANKPNENKIEGKMAQIYLSGFEKKKLEIFFLLIFTQKVLHTHTQNCMKQFPLSFRFFLPFLLRC